MKKKWIYSCFTVILFLLVACSKKQNTTKQSPIDKQIQVIADQVSVWKGEEEVLNYGYAVTDLDHNGRLELIASTCIGTGIYTYSSFYEVNENGDGLDMCEYPGAEGGSEADIMEDSANVYYDSDVNIYYYIFGDNIRCGSAELHYNMRAIYLQNGKILEKFLYSSELMFTEDDMVSKYYDAEGNLVSEEEYDALIDQVFEDLEEKQATIQWESYKVEELLSMTDKDLYEMLEKSYLGFFGEIDSKEDLDMAKYRETVCMYYVALGECKKGRDACHEHYCQKCNKYYPRVKERHVNQKKKRIQELRKDERYD